MAVTEVGVAVTVVAVIPVVEATKVVRILISR